jgi:hypothetical protein
VIDLRSRVLEWAELKRRHAAGEPLSPDEQQLLTEGISAAEYRSQILDMIRHERRSAAPSEKVKKATKLRLVESTPLINFLTPLVDFLTKEHPGSDTPSSN